MKLKSLFLLVFGSIIVLTTMMLLLVNTIYLNQDKLLDSFNKRMESVLSADELRQSSDDLTRMARTYSVTGDDRYEDMFWKILSIRNGEAPRPVNYRNIYWDFVAGNFQKPRPDGEPIALRSVFENLGFTEEEFQKLQESQDNSDALIKMENIAMHTMKGLYQDENGNFTIKGDPNPEVARNILFSAEYHAEKVRIMKPIEEFYTLIDERTTKEVNASISNSRMSFKLLLFIAISLIVLSVAGYYVINRNVIQKLGAEPKEIEQLTRKIAEGDLEHEVRMNGQQIKGVYKSALEMLVSLREMATISESISQGDLSVAIQPKSDKDIMGKAFLLMIEQLKSQMTNINGSVNKLTSSYSELTSTFTQLATSSSQTAATVSEVSTTLEEIQQTTQLATQKARSVSDSAQRSVKYSENGIKTTEDTIEGMQLIEEHMQQIAETIIRLSEQSQSIGEITSVVKDLAEQSNLLAVNASIEAVKAGEYGKGFGVVAQEIRALADQSKQAAIQIKGILDEIHKAISITVMATEQGSKAVENGMQLTEASGDSISMLADSISEAAMSSSQIASSSNQQLSGIEQLTIAMDNIKLASNQNAVAANQAESASLTVKEIVDDLRNIVNNYKF